MREYVIILLLEEKKNTFIVKNSYETIGISCRKAQVRVLGQNTGVAVYKPCYEELVY